MTVDWRVRLAAARQPPTAAQQVYDSRWDRWFEVARRTGKTPNQAVRIAYTRTEDQHGQRPTSYEECK